MVIGERRLVVLAALLGGCSLLPVRRELMDPDGDGSPYGEDCDDARADVFPGAEEVCGDGVVNDCDRGAAAAITACRTSGTQSLSGADLKLTGESDDDEAGFSVSGAGDVDGDGLADVLVGAPGVGTGGAGAGAAYLARGAGALHGVGGHLSLSGADLKLTGEAAGATAGESVSGAGDVDGDGLGDLLVGAPEGGAAYLLLGGGALGAASGVLGLSAADYKFTREVDGDYAGYSVSGAGDVDADGADDVFIGAPREGSVGADAGAAYLLLGGGALADSSGWIRLVEADVKLVGEAADAGAGCAVSEAGDVDGDGSGDLLIGASNGGAAYILLGGGVLRTSGDSGTLSLSDADLKFTREVSEDGAGASVAAVGDVDGDGLADALIGAPWNGGAGENAGAVYLLLGRGALADDTGWLRLVGADLKLTGEAANDVAGVSVSGLGDQDRDGLGDIAVGAPGESGPGGYQAGAAYLLFGGGSLAGATGTLSLADADAKFTGEDATNVAGCWVSGAGDVGGDGYDDLLVGALWEGTGGRSAGAAYLVSGRGY